MSAKKIGGIVVILVGVCSLAVWADRTFLHSSSADRAFIRRIADFGGDSSIHGKHPAAIYLLMGVGALVWGQSLVKNQ